MQKTKFQTCLRGLGMCISEVSFINILQSLVSGTESPLILFVVFLMITMQMHCLIFNTHHKELIPEICTISACSERYPNYPWKVCLRLSETTGSHFCVHFKLASCDSRDEETPALFSLTLAVPSQALAVYQMTLFMRDGCYNRHKGQHRQEQAQKLHPFWHLHSCCCGNLGSSEQLPNENHQIFTSSTIDCKGNNGLGFSW